MMKRPMQKEELKYFVIQAPAAAHSAIRQEDNDFGLPLPRIGSIFGSVK